MVQFLELTLRSFAMTARASWRVWHRELTGGSIHALHQTKGPPPLLVCDRADRDARGWAEAVYPARRENRHVPRCRGKTGGACRSLLPSHRQAVERLEQQRQYHLWLPRLDLRPHRQARAHPAVFARSAAARRARQGFPLRHALWVRVGCARGSLAADPRPSAGPRSILPAHPSVLRSLEHRSAANDGEFIRQRALLLRSQ